jgi:hypothetical protein
MRMCIWWWPYFLTVRIWNILHGSLYVCLHIQYKNFSILYLCYLEHVSHTTLQVWQSVTFFNIQSHTCQAFLGMCTVTYVQRISTLMSTIFWDIMLCSPLSVNRRSEWTHRFHPQGKQVDYTALYPRRLYSSQPLLREPQILHDFNTILKY